jgi:hypothetical protein
VRRQEEYRDAAGGREKLVAPKTDRNCTHLAGEYFVAAELSKRGYVIGITIGNAKAIDLFAEKGVKTVHVQVKALASKKSVGWPMMIDRVIPNVMYVLVCLNAYGTAPAFFILTSKETKAKVKQYRTRGIIEYSKVNHPEYLERWDKIETALR